MIKNLVLIVFFTGIMRLNAQIIKTDVLVIGGSASGVAAAIQSARSNVKTILVEPDTVPLLTGEISGTGKSNFITVTLGGVATIHESQNLSSGIWEEFRLKFKEYHKSDKDFDTTRNSPVHYDSWSGSEILKKMTDSVKNLTVNTNANFNSINKDGDFWEVGIKQNGKSKIIKTRIVVDATPEGIVASFVNAVVVPLDSVLNKPGSKLYRTAIAVADGLPGERYNDVIAHPDNFPQFPAISFPIKATIAKSVDNLLITEKLFPSKINLNYLPRQLTLGQGVGAIAAYCAFYKTTTKKIRIRIIQGELLDFKAYLLPLMDIRPSDPNWRAVQQITATGLLKGIQKTNKNGSQFLFVPDSLVDTDEIKPVLLEIYSRAFLWFEKTKPGKQFTIGNMLDLISDYTLTDPEILKTKIQKSWNTSFHFKTSFDPGRQISRLEFAVLANFFLNPFARSIDVNGQFIN